MLQKKSLFDVVKKARETEKRFFENLDIIPQRIVEWEFRERPNGGDRMKLHFKNCDFRGSCWIDCEVGGLVFENCDFRNGGWKRTQGNARFIKCDFRGAGMNSDFEGADFTESDLRDAEYNYAGFNSAIFDRTKFDENWDTQFPKGRWVFVVENEFLLIWTKKHNNKGGWLELAYEGYMVRGKNGFWGKLSEIKDNRLDFAREMNPEKIHAKLPLSVLINIAVDQERRGW